MKNHTDNGLKLESAIARGLQMGHKDSRAASFLVLLSHLRHLEHPPNYLLIENVVGFETSQTHEEMVHALDASGFSIQVHSHVPASHCFQSYASLNQLSKQST